MDAIKNFFGSKQEDSTSSRRAQNVKSLQQMGFDKTSAENALNVTDDNVDAALELLLCAASTDPIQQEQQQQRSAASRKAGEAALERFANNNAHKSKTSSRSTKKQQPTSPKSTQIQQLQQPAHALLSNNNSIDQRDIKLPSKLTDKTLEEQVTRCADRVSSHPRSVETLLKTVSSLRSDPNNANYKKIDCSSAGYRKVIASVPGAEDFLRAMKYRKMGQYFIMDQHALDPALLWMGVSALEEVKKSQEYQCAKRMLQFEADLRRIRAGVGISGEAEAVARSSYMSKTPSEPAGGQGALVQLKMADVTVMRRFDGDDQLRDVFNWIGGHGSAIPDKILRREWCVVDLNRYPVTPISFDDDMEKTLQYIGCWPSGKLELRPSDDEWRIDGETSIKMGSARGLGAA